MNEASKLSLLSLPSGSEAKVNAQTILETCNKNQTSQSLRSRSLSLSLSWTCKNDRFGGKFVCCLMQGVRLGTERNIQWISLGQLEPIRVGCWCIRMTSVITHELTSFKSLKKKTYFVHLPVSERGKTKLHKSRSEDLRMQSVRQKCLPPRRGTHFDPTHQRGLSGCRMVFSASRDRRDRISTVKISASKFWKAPKMEQLSLINWWSYWIKLQEPQALHVSRQRQLGRRIPVQSTYHHFEHLRCLHFQNVFQWWKVVFSGKRGPGITSRKRARLICRTKLTKTT